MNNKAITITEATARRAMLRLGDWLEWIEDLDAETRADIIALDELIKALDAQTEYEELIEKNREARRKSLESYHARKDAESAGE
jgi:hypothetical protein